MPKASARIAVAVPMAPNPTSPSVRPDSCPSWTSVQSSGLVIQISGIRFSKASIAANTNSEMASALAPLEQVRTRPSTRSSGNMLDTGREQMHPSDPRCHHLLDALSFAVTREEHLCAPCVRIVLGEHDEIIRPETEGSLQTLGDAVATRTRVDCYHGAMLRGPGLTSRYKMRSRRGLLGQPKSVGGIPMAPNLERAATFVIGAAHVTKIRRIARHISRQTRGVRLVVVIALFLLAAASSIAGPSASATADQSPGQVTVYGDLGIDDPTAITAGPDGNLWFTNSGNNSIGSISTSGVVDNYTGGGIDDPDAITVGPDGNLWFTNSGTTP